MPAQREEVFSELDIILHEWARQHGRTTVLEAGGGSWSHIDLPDTDITTIDISQDQLARNDYAQRKLCADLQTVQLPDDHYDLIVCYDVLEHLPQPEKALRTFFRAVRPGGLIYLAAPYNRSLTGLLTKFTPHWFHVVVYRHILHESDAGLPGHAPFPVFMCRAMNPFRLTRSAEQLGFRVLYFRLYDRGRRRVLRQRSLLAGWTFDAVLLAGRLLTAGRVALDCSDFVQILQKPAAYPAGRSPATPATAGGDTETSDRPAATALPGVQTQSKSDARPGAPHVCRRWTGTRRRR